MYNFLKAFLVLINYLRFDKTPCYLFVRFGNVLNRD